VKYATVSGGPYTTLASGLSATSQLHSGLDYGVTCYYVVSAGNSIYDGPFSSEISATTYTRVESWRLTYFGTPANSDDAADNADPDADGLTNAQEFSCGTDPTDSASALRASIAISNGSDLVVSFPTVTGKFYRVERSDTLANDSWTTLRDNISGTGEVLQVTDAGAASQAKRFYRIVLLP